ncbi:MAG: cyclic nucleotide-binding domain-containing protein [Pseudomonadota bacterium]
MCGNAQTFCWQSCTIRGLRWAPEPRQNGILASLPAKDYARLLPDLKLVEMPLRSTVSESGDHVNFLHFPVSGIVSLIYTLEDGSSSETALVGNEGLVGNHPVIEEGLRTGWLIGLQWQIPDCIFGRFFRLTVAFAINRSEPAQNSENRRRPARY